MSFTSCQLYIHLHPLTKTCLYPAADRPSAIQSPVKLRWVRSTPWKHLYLISLHRTGAFLMLDSPEVCCDNSWFTTIAQASLNIPFSWPAPHGDLGICCSWNTDDFCQVSLKLHVGPGQPLPRVYWWGWCDGQVLCLLPSQGTLHSPSLDITEEASDLSPEPRFSGMCLSSKPGTQNKSRLFTVDPKPLSIPVLINPTSITSLHR